MKATLKNQISQLNKQIGIQNQNLMLLKKNPKILKLEEMHVNK